MRIFIILFIVVYRNDIISNTREFRREFDIIKQRTTRVCNLVKTLIDVIIFLLIFINNILFIFKDFSIAAEFKCLCHNDLWQQLLQHSYARVKIYLDASVNISSKFFF